MSGKRENYSHQVHVSDLARFPEENPFPVLRLAADGTVLYSNSPGMVIVEEWGVTIGQQAPENWRAIVSEALQQNRYHGEEIRCGEKLFFVAVAPIAEGHYVNLYGRDITKQRKIEDDLRAEEKKYRLLFDRNPDGVFEVDSSGRFLQANPAWESLSGYDIEQLKEMFFFELCAPDQLEHTKQHFENNFFRKRFSQLETALIRKDGNRVELWISGEPIEFEDQGHTIYCTVRDITERKRTERAIQENEQRLRLAAEAADFGTYDVDLINGTVYWSPKFRKIVDVAPDAAVPKSGQIPDFIHPEDVERIKQMREVSYDPTSGGEIEYEFRIIRPNGQIRWVWLQGQVTFDTVEGQRAVRSTGILLDITERKLAEEKIRESYEELSRFNRLAVDRELRMIDLKKEINELCRDAGLPQRYPMDPQDGLPQTDRET